MSRSGYSEDGDYDQWSLIKWRGQVTSAIRGKRGQRFLRDLLEALDAMPVKRLIAHELVERAPIGPEHWGLHEFTGEVCAIGSLAARRGVRVDDLDPDDGDHRERLASRFGIAEQLVAEVEWENDEAGWNDTPEGRWVRVRKWVASQIKTDLGREALAE
jgi:hypothetical protein